MKVHITEVQTGDRLAQDIFNDYGLNVLSQGTVLNERELSRLFQHQVEYLEIEWRPGHGLENPPNHLDAVVKPLYEDAIAGYEQIFEKALTEGRIYENDLQESFQPFVENFKAERDVVSLLLVLNSQDGYTYQHSVQVGMLSYYIARWLGWNEEESVRASKAGFLHDIGKCKIPKYILNKPGELTDEEFQEIKNHPKYGYEIITNSFNDPLLAMAALQHHERMNGGGYPLNLSSENIHPIARIVAVADVYSAMISSRVYSEKRDLLHVLRELYQISFDELDPHTTQTFIRHMIPNFIGKKVDLKNGTQGTIVLTNPSDFFRPLVKIDEEFYDLTIHRDMEIIQVHM
jgi:putative nucleotidyltransferase with HDIG domain